ncbi:MAG TPA: hypothetical protein VMM92_12720 [Thermoanaerobaculia bacterium]|nr:hypothetical protein [Thermoanaerobaculia bacterium]
MHHRLARAVRSHGPDHLDHRRFEHQVSKSEAPKKKNDKTTKVHYSGPLGGGNGSVEDDPIPLEDDSDTVTWDYSELLVTMGSKVEVELVFTRLTPKCGPDVVPPAMGPFTAISYDKSKPLVTASGNTHVWGTYHYDIRVQISPGAGFQYSLLGGFDPQIDNPERPVGGAPNPGMPDACP